jgi:arginyl-tRNA synthetase
VFHSIEKNIFSRVAAFLEGHYGASVPTVLEEPRQPSFGELSITAPFHLARQLKRAPVSIAREIVADLGPIDGVAALEVAGNGYINVRLDRGAYGYGVLHGVSEKPEPVPGKIIVEHTNINPNKAAGRWRYKTTSTTPACKWQTSWRVFISSRGSPTTPLRS